MILAGARTDCSGRAGEFP